MIQTSRTYQGSVNMRVLTDDQIWEIRQAAFEVIEKSGFTCLHEEARQMLAAAGAVVKDERVKIPRYILEGCLGTVPKGWTIYDRNGRRAMEVEGRKSYYGTSTASPNTRDTLTGEIRETRVADIAVGARVADALPNIDFVMPMGSSQDVDGNVADLYEFEAVITNTTKPMVFIGYTPTGCEYVFEILAAVDRPQIILLDRIDEILQLVDLLDAVIYLVLQRCGLVRGRHGNGFIRCIAAVRQRIRVDRLYARIVRARAFFKRL